jgi:hypothetical protein
MLVPEDFGVAAYLVGIPLVVVTLRSIARYQAVDVGKVAGPRTILELVSVKFNRARKLMP